MAHEISNVNGIDEAFFAGNGNELRPAWHGLGQNLIDAADSETAIEQAHLDWRVLMRPLQTIDGKTVPNMCATVREDTGDVLGVVSDRYKVLQNRHCFKFLDSLVENGDLQYESAGALRGGQIIWLLARLPSIDTIAAGDTVKRYLLLQSSHDGLSAINTGATSVRVVCANTLRLSLQTNKSTMKRITHKGDMVSKLADAQLYLSQFDKAFALFRDEAQLLATRYFTNEQCKEYIQKLFPEVDLETRAKAQRERKVSQVREAFRDHRTCLASIKGTWWHLFNSVTQSIDHADKSTRRSARDAAETKMMNLTDGIGADFKAHAFAVAKEMSSVVVA